MLQESEGGKEAAVASGVLTDNRFKRMFENPDFKIDEESDEYRLLHPHAGKDERRREEELLKEHFEELEDAEEEGEGADLSDDERETHARRARKEDFKKVRERMRGLLIVVCMNTQVSAGTNRSYSHASVLLESLQD